MALQLFLATTPVIIILLYVYNKDKNKEPLILLIKLFLSGFLACVLTLIASSLFDFLPFMDRTKEGITIIDTFLYAFIGVALIEELCKWIMVMLLGYNQNEFDEVYDILIYSVFVSLGFAFIENIVYVTQIQSVRTALVRALSAVPSHACDAVFMGYFLSIAKQKYLIKDIKGEKKYIILSVAIPTILHGIYDFLIMSGIKIFTLIFFVFIIFLYWISIKRLKESSTSNKKVMIKTRFCEGCGRQIEGDICPHCGRVHNI